MSEKDKPQSARNEGEGNKTAARQYNEAQRRFVQSDAVEQKAREAEKAIEGGESASSTRPRRSASATAMARTRKSPESRKEAIAFHRR